MKFHELLSKYSDDQIIESLNKYYDDIKPELYLLALSELRVLKPSQEEQDIKINVEFSKNGFDENDKTEYLDCDGIGPDDDGKITKWGIEFKTWEDWLAMDINEECLSKLDELTILASAMWEMTYNGYTQEQTDDTRNELNEKIRDIDEHLEKFISI
jgi:hypothetical protein